LNIVFFYCLV